MSGGYEAFVQPVRDRLDWQGRHEVWTQQTTLADEWMKRLIEKVIIQRKTQVYAGVHKLIPELSDPVWLLITMCKEYCESAIRSHLEANHIYSFGQFCRAAYIELAIDKTKVASMSRVMEGRWGEIYNGVLDELYNGKDESDADVTVEEYVTVLQNVVKCFNNTVNLLHDHVALLQNIQKRVDETFQLTNSATYSLDELIRNQTAVGHAEALRSSVAKERIAKAIRSLENGASAFSESVTGIKDLLAKLETNRELMGEGLGKTRVRENVQSIDGYLDPFYDLYQTPDTSRALVYFGAQGDADAKSEVLSIRERFKTLLAELTRLEVLYSEILDNIRNKKHREKRIADASRLDVMMRKDIILDVVHHVRMAYRNALLLLAFSL